MEKINTFVNWAINNGWNVITENNVIEKLPKRITDRYNIPNEYKTFLENIKIFTNAEGNIWFFCITDYLRDEEKAFRWNEFELIGLEAANADNDQKWFEEIKEFWDRHFPIIFNVKGEYEYYAIEINSKNIVYGFEPEFEEVDIVANDFEEFLEKIMSKEIEL